MPVVASQRLKVGPCAEYSAHLEYRNQIILDGSKLKVSFLWYSFQTKNTIQASKGGKKLIVLHSCDMDQNDQILIT